MKTRPVLTLLRVRLVFETRWAVGAPDAATAETDLPVIADPRSTGGVGGRPFLPSTAVAGSLRRALGEDAVRWLGPEPAAFEEAGQTPSVGQKTGLLQFLGVIDISAAIQGRGTTRVALDRGAASDGSLRNEQWAEPGEVILVARHPGVRDDLLVEQLGGWRPVLGRGRTTGLGRARVTQVETLTIDLNDTGQLDWWLFERDTWLRDGRAPTVASAVVTLFEPDVAAPPFVRLRVEEPVHVGTGGEELWKGRRAAASMRSQEKLVIPGSSVKGVFRHRVETILALVGAGADGKAISASLFGHVGHRGRLVFRDIETGVTAASGRTHVSIDRFTGGARTTALHTVLAIPRDTALELRIDDPQGMPDAVRTLLLHVVADLHDGLIGIGKNVTRGYGWVQVEKADESVVRELQPVDVFALCRALGIEPAEVTR